MIKSLSTLLALSMTYVFAANGWETDQARAQQKARESNKDLFIVYTFPDYNRQATGKAERVFSTPFFQKNIGEKYVLLEVPLPETSGKEFASGHFIVGLADSEGSLYETFTKDDVQRGPENFLINLEKKIPSRDKILKNLKEIKAAGTMDKKKELLAELLPQLSDEVILFHPEFMKWAQETISSEDSPEAPLTKHFRQRAQIGQTLDNANRETKEFLSSINERNDLNREQKWQRMDEYFHDEIVDRNIPRKGKIQILFSLAMQKAAMRHEGDDWNSTIDQIFTVMDESLQSISPGHHLAKNMQIFLKESERLTQFQSEIFPLLESNPREGLKKIEEYKTRSNHPIGSAKIALEQMKGIFLVFDGRIDEAFSVWEKAIDIAPWSEAAWQTEELLNSSKERKNQLRKLLSEGKKGNQASFAELRELVKFHSNVDNKF